MADFAAGMAAARQGDFATALAEWAPLAEAGDRDAQANLAMMYERGAGVTLDEAVAFEWFLLAARQGHAYAAYKAGLSYQLGHGTETNKPQAVQWFASSAEAGYPGGIYEMGYAYQMGEGVDADAGQALMWFYVAATYDWADAIPARNFVERALSLGRSMPPPTLPTPGSMPTAMFCQQGGRARSSDNGATVVAV